MLSIPKLLKLAATTILCAELCGQSPAATDGPPRHSPLPEAALLQARQAEEIQGRVTMSPQNSCKTAAFILAHCAR